MTRHAGAVHGAPPRRAPPARALRAAGFTLAEIMIAVAILGFIGLLTYGVFGNSLDARDRALAVGERYHEIRQGLTRMAREISMAFLSHHYNCQDRRTATIFKKGSEGGADSLSFTSFSHVKMRRDANESDQNELTYKIDHDPERPGSKGLLRRAQHRIDDEPEEGGVEQVLIRDVSDLRFEFYDDKQDEWEDDWSSESMDTRWRLPLYVKVLLKARGPTGKEETFVTKTQIYLRTAGSPDDGLYITGLRCPE